MRAKFGEKDFDARAVLMGSVRLMNGSALVLQSGISQNAGRLQSARGTS